MKTKKHKHWTEYTNEIDTPNYKNHHKFYSWTFEIHSFNLNQYRMIPVHICVEVAKNDHMREFKENPFHYED